MKTTHIMVAVALALLVGCLPSYLPPDPVRPDLPAPSFAGYATRYEGYAPPVDVFSDEETPMFILSNTLYAMLPDDTHITVDLAVTPPSGSLTYSKGYYYDGTRWVQYELEGTHVSTSNWIAGSGIASLAFASAELPAGPNYIVAYVCQRVANQWKCGCQSQQGSCGMWMLNTFTFSPFIAPPPSAGSASISAPEVAEPGSVIAEVLIGSDAAFILPSALHLDIAGQETSTLAKGNQNCYTEGRCVTDYAGSVILPGTPGDLTLSLTDLPEGVRSSDAIIRVVPAGTFTAQLAQIINGATLDHQRGAIIDDARTAFIAEYTLGAERATATTFSGGRDLLADDLALEGAQALSIGAQTVLRTADTAFDGETTTNVTSYGWTSGTNSIVIMTERPVDTEESMLIVEAYLALHPSDIQ